jgi:hypothetical protein
VIAKLKTRLKLVNDSIGGFEALLNEELMKTYH